MPRYVALIVAAFAASSAAFVGATFVADQRLALVAARAGDVANDAMPSIDALSAMRRQLAYVQFALDEASEGNPRHMPLFDGHLQTYRDALQRYESLPQFPEELRAWETTRTHLDDTERVIEGAERKERAALRIVGWTLFALAAYVVVDAGRTLWGHRDEGGDTGD